MMVMQKGWFDDGGIMIITLASIGNAKVANN